MDIRDNRVKVTANGTDENTDFILGSAVHSFASFKSGETLYTALAETGEWQVGIGTVLGINLTRGTVEQNHLGTTAQIDFSGKVIQIAKTISADFMDDISGKLDNIEDGATADMTGAEIKVAYELELDTNAFDNAAKDKLTDIEEDATADQTGTEIKTAYEAEPDTNAFNDADKTKLDSVETNAAPDQTGAEIKMAYEGESDTNAFDDATKAKLLTIEANAAPDQTGAEIKTSYEGEFNTNVFDDAARDKLAGITDGASGNMTGAEIKLAYEAEANTNAFDDAYKTKLNAVDETATPAQTGAEIKVAYESELDTNAFNDAYKTKLDGMDDGATDDLTGSEIKNLYENELDTNAFNDIYKDKLDGIEENATADKTAADIEVVPTVTLLSTDVQAALEEVEFKALNTQHPASSVTYDATNDVLDDTLVNVQNALVAHSELVLDRNFTATGLLSGGKLVASINTSVFAVSLGEGVFVDSYSNPVGDISSTRITWDNITNIDISGDIAGKSVAKVNILLKLSLDVIEVVKVIGVISSNMLKDHIYLGAILTVDSTISGINNSPIVAKQSSDNLAELLYDSSKVTDADIKDVTGALSFWQDVGKLYLQGINWHDTDHKNPNKIAFGEIGSSIDPIPFNVINQAGIKQYTQITVLTAQYDAAGTITTIPATQATIHRLYSIGVDVAQRKYVLLLGQNLYTNVVIAQEAVYSETIIYPPEVDSMQLVAFIGVTAESTDFS
ncbi:MAG: hypothetical protein DRQ42_04790, partial [Gammaproteobacteria bacterium]